MEFSHPLPCIVGSLAVFFIIRQISVIFKFKFIRLITTPLITYCIVALAVVGIFRSGGSGWMILAALGLSLIADAVLMIPGVDLFAHGLIFFLGSHIFYTAAFSRGYSFLWWDILTIVVLLSLMIFLVIRFHRGGKLGKMMAPVIVYITALSCIVFFSFNGFLRGGDTVHLLTAGGAILFYVSDVILGWAQFVKYHRLSTLWVWFFYAPGQFFIALSLVI